MPVERYHGSRIRTLAYNLFHPVSLRLRRIRLAVQGRAPNPTVEDLLRLAEERALNEEWEKALAYAREAADVAESQPGTPTWAAGAALTSLGDCKRGLGLMGRIGNTGDNQVEWAGQELSGRTLIVRQRVKADMGGAIRLSRFVVPAARLAENCLVLTESRLVPLFQRTFPNVKVRPMEGFRPERNECDYVATLEGFASHCVTDWASISRTFVPLVADPERVAHFRQRYRSLGGGPFVGITWGSHNSRKGTPAIAAWGKLVQSFPATFVSLQYGSVAAALRTLRGRTPDKLIEDESVNQLRDMDGFAAQVAALDAVIAISNTGAHLAGALNVPTVLLRDGRLGMFPATGSEAVWYPRTVMVHRRRRKWDVVLDEASERLTEQLRLNGPFG